jgi:hypothetical protein
MLLSGTAVSGNNQDGGLEQMDREGMPQEMRNLDVRGTMCFLQASSTASFIIGRPGARLDKASPSDARDLPEAKNQNIANCFFNRSSIKTRPEEIIAFSYRHDASPQFNPHCLIRANSSRFHAYALAIDRLPKSNQCPKTRAFTDQGESPTQSGRSVL